MFAKVSDKFHRKPIVTTGKPGQSPAPPSPVGSPQRSQNAYSVKFSAPQQSSFQQAGLVGMDGTSNGTPMDGVEA